MFSIYDGRDAFYQWDLDRKLIVKDETINQAHFCNKTTDNSFVCEVYTENGMRLVNIPNIILQKDFKITVYGYDANYTKHTTVFNVIKRSKPEDYIYTENEINTYNELVLRIDEIERNGVSDERIGEAIDAYLEENPVEVDLTGYATEEYVNTAISNIEVSGGDVDLSNYYTKSEVNNLIPSTSGFITLNDVKAQGYQTAEQVESAINEALGVIENGTY